MKKRKLIDIHTHIIPNVDDGSNSFNESLEMLNIMIGQGITNVIATPHVNSNATTATWERQVSQYKILKERAKHLNIKLKLGAEVKYREHLMTDYKKHCIEGTNYILMEFSWGTKEDVHGVLKDLQNQGLKPIVAHVERYSYLTLDDYKKLKENGVLLQVNTGAILGLGRDLWVKNAQILLGESLVDFIATDAHNTRNRIVNLEETYEYLSTKIDRDYLNDLFYNNALKLIK